MIALFSHQEESVVRACLVTLKSRTPELFRVVKAQEDALRRIADSVSAYPPILGEQRLAGRARSAATLVETLRYLDETNRELKIPAKAVLGRSLVVARTNYLVMLRRLASRAAGLGAFRQDLDDAVLQNVMTLMGEDVFLSLIEDGRNTAIVREAAALRLAGIWEYRLDRERSSHAPQLLSLWEARRVLRPMYGTMMGVSEITRITLRVEPEWAAFLSRAGSREAAQALEEFVFGLSHEELAHLRRAMKKRGLAAIDGRRVSTLIRGRRRFPSFENRDPRKLYEFYRQRRSAASERRIADRPGPRVTIEELLLGHLLEEGESACGRPERVR